MRYTNDFTVCINCAGSSDCPTFCLKYSCSGKIVLGSDCPIASYRPSDLRSQVFSRYTRGIQSGDDVELLSVDGVNRKCPWLVYSSRQESTWGPCSVDNGFTVLPACTGCVTGRRASATPHAARRAWTCMYSGDETRCSIQWYILVIRQERHHNSPHAKWWRHGRASCWSSCLGIVWLVEVGAANKSRMNRH